MTTARLHFIDGDGYRRSVVLDVPAEVDTDTLVDLITEIDPGATFEYATGEATR